MQKQCNSEGIWDYPPLVEAMSEAGPEEVETYVLCYQNTIAQYIKTRPIFDLFLEAEQRLGERVANILWE